MVAGAGLPCAQLLAAPTSQASMKKPVCTAASSPELQEAEAAGTCFWSFRMRAASALTLLPFSTACPPPQDSTATFQAPQT